MCKKRSLYPLSRGGRHPQSCVCHGEVLIKGWFVIMDPYYDAHHEKEMERLRAENRALEAQYQREVVLLALETARRDAILLDVKERERARDELLKQVEVEKKKGAAATRALEDAKKAAMERAKEAGPRK